MESTARLDLNSLGESFDRLSRALAVMTDEGVRAAEAFAQLLRVYDDGIPERAAQLTSCGGFMYRIAMRLTKMERLDALVWCEQFPGAFTTDFGDGWE